MKRYIFWISILLIIVGFNGCAGAQLKVNVQSDKKPISMNQFLKASNQCNPNILSIFGSPNKIDGKILYYNISGQELKRDSTIQVRNYYSDKLTLDTKVVDLKYKTTNVARDRYYLYLNNIIKAKCKARSSGGYRGIYVKSPYQTQTKSQYQQETMHLENETQDAKNRVQNYEEKMLLLKEELMKNKVVLPVWFKY